MKCMTVEGKEEATLFFVTRLLKNGPLDSENCLPSLQLLVFALSVSEPWFSQGAKCRVDLTHQGRGTGPGKRMPTSRVAPRFHCQCWLSHSWILTVEKLLPVKLDLVCVSPPPAHASLSFASAEFPWILCSSLCVFAALLQHLCCTLWF